MQTQHGKFVGNCSFCGKPKQDHEHWPPIESSGGCEFKPGGGVLPSHLQGKGAGPGSSVVPAEPKTRLQEATAAALAPVAPEDEKIALGKVPPNLLKKKDETEPVEPAVPRREPEPAKKEPEPKPAPKPEPEPTHRPHPAASHGQRPHAEPPHKTAKK